MSPRNSFTQSGRVALVVLLMAIATSVGARLLTVSAPMLNVDEAYLAAAAVYLSDTGTLPVMAKPPGGYLFYQAAFAIGGAYDMVSVRLLCLLWVLATAGFLFLAGRALGGAAAGFWSASFYLLVTSVNDSVLACKTEIQLSLPLAAALWLMIRALQQPRASLFFLAGVTGTGAALFKQPAILLLGGAGAALLTFWYRPTDWLGRRWAMQGVLWLAAGCAIVLIALSAIYAMSGGFQDFVYDLYTLPSLYATVDRISPFRRLIRLVTYTEEYARYFPLFALAGMCGLVAGWFAPPAEARNDAETARRDRVAARFLPFAAASMLCAVALGADAYIAYYIMLVPVLCISAGYFCGLIASPRIWSSLAPVVRAAAIIAVGAGIGSVIVLSLKEPVKASVEPMPSNKDPVASRLLELASPADRLYVWGASPQIYLISRLHPASRFIITDHLVGFFGEGIRSIPHHSRDHLIDPKAWPRFIADLDRNKPKFIVDAHRSTMFGMDSFPIENYALLKGFMAQHCVEDSEHEYMKTRHVIFTCRYDSP